MFRKQLPIKPTRVNDSYVRGTLYHLDRISEDDARALGIVALPGPGAGSVARHDGVVARRLRGGAMNVTIESTSGVLLDVALERFMRILLDPREHGEAETRPAQLIDPENQEPVPGGVIKVDITAGRIEAMPEASYALNLIGGECAPGDHEGHLARVHPEDRARVRAAMSRLVE